MIAGQIHLHGISCRVVADYDAVARIAAAAGLGIDGLAGHAEVQRFIRAVIDPRDLPRWQRTETRATSADRDAALATAIAVVNRKATQSDDPALAAWGWDMRAAIVRFRAGDLDAFRDLAARQALAVGQLL